MHNCTRICCWHYSEYEESTTITKFHFVRIIHFIFVHNGVWSKCDVNKCVHHVDSSSSSSSSSFTIRFEFSHLYYIVRTYILMHLYHIHYFFTTSNKVPFLPWIGTRNTIFSSFRIKYSMSQSKIVQCSYFTSPKKKTKAKTQKEDKRISTKKT